MRTPWHRSWARARWAARVFHLGRWARLGNPGRVARARLTDNLPLCPEERGFAL